MSSPVCGDITLNPFHDPKRQLGVLFLAIVLKQPDQGYKTALRKPVQNPLRQVLMTLPHCQLSKADDCVLCKYFPSCHYIEPYGWLP